MRVVPLFLLLVAGSSWPGRDGAEFRIYEPALRGTIAEGCRLPVLFEARAGAPMKWLAVEYRIWGAPRVEWSRIDVDAEMTIELRSETDHRVLAGFVLELESIPEASPGRELELRFACSEGDSGLSTVQLAILPLLDKAVELSAEMAPLAESLARRVEGQRLAVDRCFLIERRTRRAGAVVIRDREDLRTVLGAQRAILDALAELRYALRRAWRSAEINLRPPAAARERFRDALDGLEVKGPRPAIVRHLEDAVEARDPAEFRRLLRAVQEGQIQVLCLLRRAREAAAELGVTAGVAGAVREILKCQGEINRRLDPEGVRRRSRP